LATAKSAPYRRTVTDHIKNKMSFDPRIPCNCLKNGLTNWPDFKEKLEIRNGMIEIKGEYNLDLDVEKKFDSWKFCDHNQIAFERSMAQSIIGWRKHVQDKYPGKFTNFENFIPFYNDVYFHNYDKHETIAEIKSLKNLEDSKFHDRLNQFIELLEKAIELDQNIYW